MKAWIKKARATLEKCPSIEKVSETQVIFTKKFKVSAVKDYKTGKSPSEIFLDAGLSPNLFLRSYCTKRIIQWTKSFDRHGSFNEERRGKQATGRPKGATTHKNPKTAAEVKARLAYLEAENDFLKKLHALVKQGK
jgi:transposase